MVPKVVRYLVAYPTYSTRTLSFFPLRKMPLITILCNYIYLSLLHTNTYVAENKMYIDNLCNMLVVGLEDRMAPQDETSSAPPPTDGENEEREVRWSLALLCFAGDVTTYRGRRQYFPHNIPTCILRSLN
jgi:hypothetical protein